MHERAHAPERYPRQFSQRLQEHLDVTAEQCPQHQACIELAAFAQVSNKRLDLLLRRDRSQHDGCLFARLFCDALRTIRLQPRARGDEAGKRLRQLGHQGLARGRGQIIARKHRLAEGAEMPKAGNDAVKREWSDLRGRILGQDEARFRRADLGDGGRYRPRQRVAIGDSALRLHLAGGNRIDEISVEQERRMLEHPRGHLRLVGGEAENDCRGRLLTESQRPCQLGAHHRRGIVEEHDQRAFRCRAIIRTELGIKIGARQCGGRIRSLSRAGRAHPLQELANDHGAGKA